MYYNGELCKTIEELEAAMERNNEPQSTREYLRAVFNGTIPTNASTVPPVITARQFRLALLQVGITISQIEDFIDSLPEPQKSIVYIWWEYSNEFYRDNQLLNQFAPLLNVTQQQLDQIFIIGASL